MVAVALKFTVHVVQSFIKGSTQIIWSDFNEAFSTYVYHKFRFLVWGKSVDACMHIALFCVASIHTLKCETIRFEGALAMDRNY